MLNDSQYGLVKQFIDDDEVLEDLTDRPDNLTNNDRFSDDM